MLSGSELSFTENSRQLGVGRSTLYRHLHASGWEREAPGRTEPLANHMNAAGLEGSSPGLMLRIQKGSGVSRSPS